MSHTDHPCADADVFRRGAEHGEIEILPNPAQPALPPVHCATTAAYSFTGQLYRDNNPFNMLEFETV